MQSTSGTPLFQTSGDQTAEIERLVKLVTDLQQSNSKLTTQLHQARQTGEALIAERGTSQHGAKSFMPSPLATAGDMKLELPSTERSPGGHVNEMRSLAATRRKRLGNGKWDATSTNDPSEEDSMPEQAPKTEEQRQRMLAALKQRAPFNSLSESLQLNLIDAMGLKEAKAGDVLIKEGDEGHHCYLLDSGLLVVTSKGEERAQLKEGTVFGEVSLFYNVRNSWKAPLRLPRPSLRCCSFASPSGLTDTCVCWGRPFVYTGTPDGNGRGVH